jgi:DNA-binding LytR/AlgR family response regulator
MYTCLAIDDEFSALEAITDYIGLQPELKLLKTFSNPLIALNEINNYNNAVDIIFLDIEMPEMNGIELAKLIRNKTDKLVFTTAYANYAINSYELEADGFLLKPFSPSKFIQTTQKLFSKRENDTKAKKESKDYIVIKSAEQRNRYIKIQTDKIIVVEAQARYTKICTKEEIFFSNTNFSEVYAQLAALKGFVQIHRSFIISENKIKAMERSYVILNNDLKVSIGRKYLDFYRIMSNKN